MANSYRNVAGLNPEDVYDPDIIGDGPVAAISDIGYRRADGLLLRFAALKYGSAAPNHGCRIADGRDFSALWAKKGTAKYSIPPPTYAGITITAIGRGTIVSSITLDSNGTWSGSDGQVGTWYGSTLTGVGAGYEMRATVSGGSAGVTNPAASIIGLSSPVTIQFSSTGTGNRSVMIEIRPVGKAVESTGTVMLQNTIDG